MRSYMLSHGTHVEGGEVEEVGRDAVVNLTVAYALP
jgi:hypothetical protein